MAQQALHDTDVSEVTVRHLEEADLDAADRIFRIAFGTALGLPDPARFAAGAELVRSRWRADAGSAYVAELDGRIVGSGFATRWGSFAKLGPLTVDPTCWDLGVGRRLWQARLPLLERWQTTHAGLFTRADQTKNVHLYQKFGFWPRFLTALTAKQIELPSLGSPATFSALSPAGRQAALDAGRELTGALYPGLDLGLEIGAVDDQGLGETLLIDDGEGLAGLAVCHVGEGSEAGPGASYVKFAAVRPGAGQDERFERLVDACEALAATTGNRRLVAGVNLANHEAYVALLGRGYRAFAQGVAMHRPNEPGFSREGLYVLGDWR